MDKRWRQLRSPLPSNNIKKIKFKAIEKEIREMARVLLSFQNELPLNINTTFKCHCPGNPCSLCNTLPSNNSNEFKNSENPGT